MDFQGCFCPETTLMLDLDRHSFSGIDFSWDVDLLNPSAHLTHTHTHTGKCASWAGSKPASSLPHHSSCRPFNDTTCVNSKGSAGVCVCVCMWIHVYRHARITCRSHLAWQYKNPHPAYTHTRRKKTLLVPPRDAWPSSTPRVVFHPQRSVTVL